MPRFFPVLALVRTLLVFSTPLTSRPTHGLQVQLHLLLTPRPMLFVVRLLWHTLPTTSRPASSSTRQIGKTLSLPRTHRARTFLPCQLLVALSHVSGVSPSLTLRPSLRVPLLSVRSVLALSCTTVRLLQSVFRNSTQTSSSATPSWCLLKSVLPSLSSVPKRSSRSPSTPLRADPRDQLKGR